MSRSRNSTLRALVAIALAGCCPPDAGRSTVTAIKPATDVRELAVTGERHLQNLHQLTFGADNAEAYWSFGGDRLIFQTNRKPYQCDQIEEMPASGGPSKLVSTGKGRTTCSYYLKGDQEIIYASTHEASPSCPTPPDMSKGYYWGLFEYDIYRANADGSNLRRLTDSPGYDAEATVCPVDGSILFTSVRSGDLELWRMDADGKNPRQLTNMVGYDGGGVWSPDCTKIAWRASRPQPGKELDEYKALLARQLVKPTKMDLWVANADGTEAKQITYLPGASFGPAFFPDGKRLIFASNYLQPRGPEFDLFAVEIDGAHLERLTFADGFDGFPMFSPDGKQLSFSSNRRDVVKTDKGDVYRLTGGPAGVHDTNVYVADWIENPDAHDDVPTSRDQPETTWTDKFHDDITWLASDAREGRGIGTKGLADAADYVQRRLQGVGAQPGNNGAWRQTFEVTTRIERGAATALTIDGRPRLDPAQFVPLPFSSVKPVTAPIVAAGWGIVDEAAKLDDYKGRDVKGKIVVVHRFAPAAAADPKAAAERGDLRRKAFVARQHGAVGMIVVDDGDLAQEEAALPELVPGGIGDEIMGGQGDAGIPVVVATRAAAAAWVKGTHKVTIAVTLDHVRSPTDNVIGVIHAGAAEKLPGVIVLGAHLDHLGMGGGSSALDPKVHAVHNGADDNASGVAALLGIAGMLDPATIQRDVYLIAFSGEEEGDLGSDYFVKHAPFDPKTIVAMINMDMVGRMRGNHLSINGGESAKEWTSLVEPACAAARVECTIGGSGYGPSDHMPFYVAGIPVLFLFTGNHLDYHTATDDADKINAAGGARVAMIVADVTKALASRGDRLTFVKAPPEHTFGDVRHVGASLGTVPSYSEDPNLPPGVLLSDVVPGGAAANAGLKGGDRIVKVGTVDIRSINDLMFVLQTAKPGTDTKVTFVRDNKQQTVPATFGVPRGKR